MPGIGRGHYHRAFHRLFDQCWGVMQLYAALLFLTSTVALFLFATVKIRASLGKYYNGCILGGTMALLLIFLFELITAFVSHMTSKQRVKLCILSLLVSVLSCSSVPKLELGA